MPQRRFAVHNGNSKKQNVLDYLLYTLAGAVLATMSFSFLLWLRF